MLFLIKDLNLCVTATKQLSLITHIIYIIHDDELTNKVYVIKETCAETDTKKSFSSLLHQYVIYIYILS